MCKCVPPRPQRRPLPRPCRPAATSAAAAPAADLPPLPQRWPPPPSHGVVHGNNPVAAFGLGRPPPTALFAATAPRSRLVHGLFTVPWPCPLVSCPAVSSRFVCGGGLRCCSSTPRVQSISNNNSHGTSTPRRSQILRVGPRGLCPPRLLRRQGGGAAPPPSCPPQGQPLPASLDDGIEARRTQPGALSSAMSPAGAAFPRLSGWRSGGAAVTAVHPFLHAGPGGAASPGLRGWWGGVARPPALLNAGAREWRALPRPRVSFSTSPSSGPVAPPSP